MFKFKAGYYLKSTPEKIKLIDSTKSRIARDKNGENVTFLEITEEVLIHFNIVNSYQ